MFLQFAMKSGTEMELVTDTADTVVISYVGDCLFGALDLVSPRYSFSHLRFTLRWDLLFLPLSERSWLIQLGPVVIVGDAWRFSNDKNGFSN